MILNYDYFNRIEEILKPYHENLLVQSQKDKVQHGTTSLFEHCMNVVRVSVYLDAKLRSKSDLRVLVVGAFLHDFFLYDWHTENPIGWHHSYRHPVIACENAIRVFGIDEEIQRVIKSHMWPWPPVRTPFTREAMIVCLADKYCSLMETFKKPVVVASM